MRRAGLTPPAVLRAVPAWALLGLGLSITAVSPVAAQDARITNDVDTTLVTVGDQIRMTVLVDHVAGARVVWPDSLDLSPFEVLAADALPPSTQGDRVRSGAVLTLTAFELGELEIPSIPVRVDGPGDASVQLTTDRFGIEVVSVGVDEGGDIRGIRGPLGIPVGMLTVSLFLLVLVAVGLMAVWLFRRWRRGRMGQGSAGPDGSPRRPPHEIALEALDRIEASPMLSRGQVKDYHIEASETLRTYVEQRFEVPALEMTTREVAAGLRRARAPSGFTEGFIRFLNQCDLVKFAKVRPDADRSRAVLVLGRELVEQTIAVQNPRPEEVVEEGDVAEPVASSPSGQEGDA